MATRRTLRAAARRLAPPLDVDVLLAHVLEIAREQLYAYPDEPVSDDRAAAFAGLLERRAAGEPVAYLVGHREFHGLSFAVGPGVLVPRPETETLVDQAVALLRRRPGRGAVAVDLGTGSGAIAIALAVCEPDLHVIATDVSPDALAVARANAMRHGVTDRVEFRLGDLLAPIDRPVDLVCANLPYLRSDDEAAWHGERAALRYEPRTALLGGPDGLELVRRAAGDVARVLAPGGAALFEVDPAQVDAVVALLAPLGRPRVVADLAGRPRVVAVSRRS